VWGVWGVGSREMGDGRWEMGVRTTDENSLKTYSQTLFTIHYPLSTIH
jgi:hypothetical protein